MINNNISVVTGTLYPNKRLILTTLSDPNGFYEGQIIYGANLTTATAPDVIFKIVSKPIINNAPTRPIIIEINFIKVNLSSLVKK